MRRTYFRSLILTGIMAMTGPLLPHASTAKSLFESKPLPQDQFIVLGRQVGDSQWTLLVLEQIKPEPRCWMQRTDGLIDPSLNRFNFTGICGRMDKSTAIRSAAVVKTRAAACGCDCANRTKCCCSRPAIGNTRAPS